MMGWVYAGRAFLGGSWCGKGVRTMQVSLMREGKEEILVYHKEIGVSVNISSKKNTSRFYILCSMFDRIAGTSPLTVQLRRTIVITSLFRKRLSSGENMIVQ
ncbi:hypothetical protein H2248_003221 [Termitomyces sp. 'cryptogamus']|nr:hypothetical protein H2248_003221 [Termitomyces sp. 'cryptogamus']